ncbi:MAG: hypothetical protein B6I26_07755 [Desulfobacteraceae bacterium 4572_130]|nr:MAG: hypothetical protein B6I26_07755 [Desulfobacteraceae bacterium 4572_130]
MTQKIPLYRPQQIDSNVLESILVAREPLVKKILTGLKNCKNSISRQHYLFIGPRGIGKTFLTQIVKNRIIKDAGLNKQWHTITFPEEFYKLSSVADILLEALKILSEELKDKFLNQIYDDIQYNDDNEQVVDISLDAFRKFCLKSNKKILLIIENVNRIFEKQIKAKTEIHLLRKILMEENWLITLFTSPTYLNAVTKPEEPFFEFFNVSLIKDLTQNEQFQMLEKISELNKNKVVKKHLYNVRSRISAIYHFTGGNPRLAVMLYDLVSNKNISGIKLEIEFLLDQITPFYQDRMNDISHQEGEILETMALMSEGCTPSELSKKLRMESKKVRSILSRLDNSGYVRREKRQNKKTIYIIPERFFRIWHQMNHSRAARGQIQYLLEFFSAWYDSEKERDQIWEELNQKLHKGINEVSEDIDEFMEYVIAVSKEGEKYNREFDRLSLDLDTDDLILKIVRDIDYKYKSDANYFIHKGFFLGNKLKRHDEAVKAFKEACSLDNTNVVAIFNKALALEKLGQKELAQKGYSKTKNILMNNEIDSSKIINAKQVLLKILKKETNHDAMRITAYIISQSKDENMVRELVDFLNTTKEIWRKQYFIIVLGKIGSEKEIDLLIQCLNDTPSNVRGSAATALGNIGSETAVNSLIQCLNDTANYVRGSAATALGKIGSETAVEPLIRLLNDKAIVNRGSAATALGKIGSETAVNSLIQSLNDTANNVRGSAATALGKIGSETAVNSLIQSLNDTADNVRWSAATALGRIGSEKAIDSLIQCLNDTANDVRGSAATALGKIGSERAVKLLIKKLYDDKTSVGQSAVIAIALSKLVIKKNKSVLGIIDIIIGYWENPSKKTIHYLLKGVFYSGNIKIIQKALKAAEKKIEQKKISLNFFTPYKVALDYLKSNKNALILKRQHPEMRDAVILLIKIFDGAV